MSNRVAIIDYGVGNLFSVAQACAHVGLSPEITSNPDSVANADAVILPGVGAFAYAMAQLRELGMVEAIRSCAESGKPLLGVCLGFQLLFEASEEMGSAKGLGLLSGIVRPLSHAIRETGYAGTVRIPNVAWLSIAPPVRLANQDVWSSTLLNGVEAGAQMYFVHSYFVDTPQHEAAIAEVTYQGFSYCCAVSTGNIFGCQFHPEKSSASGLQIYRNLARSLGVT
jgi:imidazole glycerol-phosphate synthase subunit HisH